jgi:hypothetical protein
MDCEHPCNATRERTYHHGFSTMKALAELSLLLANYLGLLPWESKRGKSSYESYIENSAKDCLLELS